MQNAVLNTYVTFHNDRLRNDRSLENRKSDNNKKKNVGGAWRAVSGRGVATGDIGIYPPKISPSKLFMG